jgi:hypothetical protein
VQEAKCRITLSLESNSMIEATTDTRKNMDSDTYTFSVTISGANIKLATGAQSRGAELVRFASELLELEIERTLGI